MTPGEFKELTDSRPDVVINRIFSQLLKNTEEALLDATYKASSNKASLVILYETDKEYCKKQLATACKKLLQHYRDLGWVAGISKDLSFSTTPKHTLNLINTDSKLLNWWSRVWSDY